MTKSEISEKELEKALTYIAVMEKIGNLKLFPYQINFIIDCVLKKRVVGVFGRQMGKTTTIALFLAAKCIIERNQHCLVIAPTDRQASELFKRMKSFVEASEYARKFLKNSTGTELTFFTGCRVRSMPTGDFGHNIRGQTANLIVLEESSYIKDEIVGQVIMPMIAATNGSIIQIGTPFGRNHYYEASMSDNYASHHYNYKYCPLINEEFIKEQRNNLTDMEFRMEYLAEFVEDSDAYFPQHLIQSCIGDVELQNHAKWPDSKYYLGVDFARMGQDSSVFIVVEQKENGQLNVVHIEETKHKLLTDAIGRIKMLNKQFRDFERITLDETGLGAGPTDILKEELSTVEGLRFTVNSKQDLYSNLKGWMEKGLLFFPQHKKLIYELSDLRYEMTSSGNMKIHHSERGHDDMADAVALAVYPLKHGFTDGFAFGVSGS